MFNLILFSLHNLSGLFATAFDYTPFSVEFGVSDLVFDESHYYAAAPKHFQIRGGLPGEVDVYELRDVPNGHPLLHAVVLGWLARLLGADWGLELAWILGHAVFPTVAWFLLYLIAKAVTGHTWLSMALAWTVTIVPLGPRNALFVSPFSFIQPVEITRLASPALTLPVLLLAILLAWKALTTGRYAWLLAAAVAGGTLVYAYYFYWIAWYAAGGFLVAAFAYQRDWRLVRQMCAILALGVLLGAPHLLRNFEGMQHGGQRELMLRMGTFTHDPNWPAAMALPFSVLLVAWLASRSHAVGPGPAWLLLSILAAVVAGGVFGLNFHVLTGFDAQHEHFFNRLLQPLGVLFASLTAFALLRESRWRSQVRTLSLLAIPVVVLLAGMAIYRQVQVGLRTASFHRLSDSRMSTLLWIRRNVDTEAVVGASDDRLYTLMPTVTGRWTFVPIGIRSIASKREILLRYALVSWLEGKDWEETLHALTEESAPPYFRSIVTRALISETRISPQTLAMAQSIWNGLDPKEDLASRKLDYLVVPASRPLTEMRVSRAAVVYENRDWRVLKLAN
jgi:hypothetical protein